MKFIIRDDDTCGFTKVEELEECYKNILPHIPVSLSITPFRISGEGDSFSHNKILYEPYPLDKNPELVSFLKEKISSGQIEAALHGYHHFVMPESHYQKKLDSVDTRFRNKEYLYGKDLEQKTKEGKTYLEELLNCIVTTFVPPSNSIGKKGIRAVEKNNLNLVTSYPLWDFKNRPVRLRYLTALVKKEMWNLKNKMRGYPFVMRFKTYKEISYNTLGPSAEYKNIIGSLKKVNSVNGIFVLATHYQSFNRTIKTGETIKDALNKIIEEANKLYSTKFVSYKEIWN
jgi:alpha-amylase/alpha-mannosidase (GH57 family)